MVNDIYVYTYIVLFFFSFFNLYIHAREKKIAIYIIEKNLFNTSNLYIFLLYFKGILSGHENRVTSLSVTNNGMAVASCSWDQNVRVWV